METETSIVCNDQLSVFEALPEFEQKAAVTKNEGIALSCLLLSLTPEMAKKLLLCQVKNRNPSLSRVAEYRRRMEAGEWVLGEPWLFDVDGFLIDGQHRAMALSRIQMPYFSIPVLLIQGFPSETQGALDIGMNRAICSIAQLQGVPLNPQCLSIMNAMQLLGPNGSKKTFTSPELAIKAFQQLREQVTFASIERGGADSRFYSPVRAVVALAYPHENHEALARFLTAWDTMTATNDVEKNAVRLRVQYENSSDIKGGASTARIAMARKTVSALSAFLRGQELKMIREKKECPWEVPLFK